MAETKEILTIGLLGVGGYFLYKWYESQVTGASTVSVPVTTQQPGTTTPGQTTSVSPSPPTTPAPAPTPPSVVQPTPADLQKVINMTVANADQWNVAYRQLVGYGIEQVYGGSFDSIYGPVRSDGTRVTGNISAQAFLSAPAMMGLSALTKLQPLAGLGMISLVPGLQQIYQQQIVPYFHQIPSGQLVYQAHHPSPYWMRPRNISGMGALVQSTGFEKALWAGSKLRSNRII